MFWKNIRAPRKNNTVVFVVFSKKIDLSKNTFFPKWSKFLRSKIEKKGQKSLIGALRTPKSFFKNFRSKHMGSPEISVGGLLIMMLGHFFEKPVLRLTAKNYIFFENSRENLKENFLHLAFFLNFFSLFFVERCISTNSSPIPSKFVLETNTIIDVNLIKIYAHALPRACAVAIFSRAFPKKRCSKSGFSKNMT